MSWGKKKIFLAVSDLNCMIFIFLFRNSSNNTWAHPTSLCRTVEMSKILGNPQPTCFQLHCSCFERAVLNFDSTQFAIPDSPPGTVPEPTRLQTLSTRAFHPCPCKAPPASSFFWNALLPSLKS